VLNASPPILLARAGLEHLLLKLPEQVVVPRAVEIEIQAGPVGDLARQILNAGKFSIIEAPSREEILTWDLGGGETTVLSYALSNPGWVAVLDDRAARTCAKSYSIPCKGTLAVVILAKQAGVIDSAADAMRLVQAAGLRLDDAIVRQALKQIVGEDW
jgi:predicted nucleic acid-binding protein